MARPTASSVGGRHVPVDGPPDAERVPETLMDRRRRLLRADLAGVALGLFAERGFELVTVDEIAAAAGMSPRTFFRYFPSKEEVVLDYERRLQVRLVAALEARPPGEGAVRALREAYRDTAHVEPADRPRVVQLGRILDAAPSLAARVHGERVAGTEALVEPVARRMRVPVDDPRPRVVVSAMSAVAASEYRTWLHDGGEGDPADRIVASLALVERGLGHLDRPGAASDG